MEKFLRNLSVIMPALNEEENILEAIGTTLTALEEYGIDGEIIVVNDGSTDRTEEVVRRLMEKESRIRLIRHQRPQGIGSCFWDGVDASEARAVVTIPGDNENIPQEILRYYPLLNNVDMIIPFVVNRCVRSRLRNFLSRLYRAIILTSFRIRLHYTNGNIIYCTFILKELDRRNSGFFFQSDILVRLLRKGYLFAEVPYFLKERACGVSKALRFKSLWGIATGYLGLINDCYLKARVRPLTVFAAGSVTAARRNSKK